MQNLSNLDAAFIHLEKPSCPMHVGAILYFSAEDNRSITLTQLQEHLSPRISAQPLFRQRLCAGRLGHYSWKEATDFSLNQHIRSLTCPGPLTEESVDEVITRFFAQALDRRFPLWELLLLKGDPDAPQVHRLKTSDEFAFVCLIKVHHAAVDGVSAESVISALLDGLDSTPATAVPGKAIEKTFRSRMQHFLHSADVLKDRISQELWRTLPYYTQAPVTPFAASDTLNRQHIGITLSMTQLQYIKKQRPGTTLNDVLLGVIGGALRHYLAAQEQLPQASLIALTPVSKRATPQLPGGNQISAMLIDLATEVTEPLERLKKVHENAVVAKIYNQKLQIENLFASLPHQLVALTLKTWSSLRLSRKMPALFNVIVTNVPGSRNTLSLAGFPLQKMHGVAPIYDKHALTVVIVSYTDQVSIHVTCTRKSVTDPAALRLHLHASMQAMLLACEAETTPQTPAQQDTVIVTAA